MEARLTALKERGPTARKAQSTNDNYQYWITLHDLIRVNQSEHKEESREFDKWSREILISN